MKTINGTARFPLLTRLAKFLSLLPHSNADTEGTFQKNMEQITLCALVACKLYIHPTCFKLNTPKVRLKQSLVAWITIKHTVTLTLSQAPNNFLTECPYFSIKSFFFP